VGSFFVCDQVKEDEMGGHVARMGVSRNVYRSLAGESEGVDGRIILEWILRKYDGKVWTGFIWLRIGNSGGFL
jgi:uncharacterized membrane protein YjdF